MKNKPIFLVTSILWATTILLFLAEAYFFGKDVSPGTPYSKTQSTAFLITIAFGFIFFAIAFLTFFVFLYKKIKTWEIVVFLTLLILFGFISVFGLFIYISHEKQNVPNWSGQELFNAVNKQRESVGVSPITLGEGLCDNLVSRWQNVRDGKKHEGAQQWYDQEGINTKYGYGEIAELYITAETPEKAVEFWVNSPGHKLELDNPKWTDGCTYASEGIGILELSSKVKNKL